MIQASRLMAGARSLVAISTVLTFAFLGCDAEDKDHNHAEETPAGDGTQTPTPSDSSSPSPAPQISAFKVVGSSPSAGAMAVPGGARFTLFFNQELTARPEAIEATVTDPGGTSVTLGFLELGDDKKSISFAPFGLAPDTDYTLRATFQESADQEIPPVEWPLKYEAHFSTTVPCGVSFDIAQGVTVEQLGANPGLATMLNKLLASTGLTPVALMFINLYAEGTFPVNDLMIASGLAYKSSEQDAEGHTLYDMDEEFGLPVTMGGCEIDASGGFSCGPATFVFPIPITSDTTVNLYISEARVSGDVASSGGIDTLTNFLLSGVITEENVQRLFEEAGMGDLSELVVLDVDLDGDNVNDAATAVASSTPRWIQFATCYENR